MKVNNCLFLILFVIFFCSCKQIPQKVLAATNPYVYVSPFNTYDGEYKTISFKTFSLQFPKNVTVDTQTFNNFMYQIEANGTNHYKIFVLPFENDPENVGKLLTGLSVFSNPYIPFRQGNMERVYYNNKEEDNPLKYEVFCYKKSEYIFYIFSFGDADNFYSAFDIVKSTKVMAPSISNEVRKNIATTLIKKYQKELLTIINTKFQEEGYKGVKILGEFYCEDVKTSILNKNIKVECIIGGDYSQLYPGQRSMINGILHNVNFKEPYDTFLELLGYSITVNFYKISGERI